MQITIPHGALKLIVVGEHTDTAHVKIEGLKALYSSLASQYNTNILEELLRKEN